MDVLVAKTIAAARSERAQSGGGERRRQLQLAAARALPAGAATKPGSELAARRPKPLHRQRRDDRLCGGRPARARGGVAAERGDFAESCGCLADGPYGFMHIALIVAWPIIPGCRPRLTRSGPVPSLAFSPGARAFSP